METISPNTDVEAFLLQQAASLSSIFGASCETAVYRVEGNTSRILSIRNSKVTNRKVGGSFEDIPNTDDAGVFHELVNNFYKGKNETRVQVRMTDGRILKISVSHFITDSGHWALSVIFDATVFVWTEMMIRHFNGKAEEEVDQKDQEEQRLEDIFDSCLTTLGIPIFMMTKPDRVEMVRMLRERNAFSFQKSIPFVAKKLRVSRYSIYNYLRELEQQG